MKTQNMIFSTKQDQEEIISLRHPDNLKHPAKAHHLSSFGLLNRNGLEIATGISLPEIVEEKSIPYTEFADWLPLQEQWGYIPMRKFDFW